MDGNGVAAHNDCPSSRSCGEIMSGHQRHHLLPLALATSVGAMALGISTAQAHSHPTPIERAAPAVVFIEARAHVEVTLIEHDLFPDKHGIHVHVFPYTSDPLLDTASGFFVNPSGTVVTTGALLRQNLDKGEVWAINQAFAKRYPKQARLPADPFVRQHIGPRTDRIEQRLQACYPPHLSLQDAGGCVVRRSATYVVHPGVTDQRTYGNLPAEPDTKHSTTDVGLLRVRSNGVPSVIIAPPLPTDRPMDVLGYVGIPGPVPTVPDPKNTNPHGMLDIAQHFIKGHVPLLQYTGLTADEADGSAMLKQQLGKGVEGGPVVDGGKDANSGGQVIGLFPGPAPSGQPVPTLVSATAILGVLKSAGVPNQTSLTDTQFEEAMHHFKNKEYAASIPFLEATLRQFRGHALAAADLATAKAQVAKGLGSPTMTPATATRPVASQSSSGTGLLVGGLVVAVVAALVALGLALRQRRRGRHDAGKAAPKPATGPPAAPPGGRSATGSAPSDRGTPARAHSSAGAPPSGAPGASTGAASGAAPSRVRERPNVLHRAPSTVSGPDVQPSATRRPANNNPSTGHQPTAGARSAAPAPAPTATRFCTSCGGRLAAGHRFCGRCGAAAGD